MDERIEMENFALRGVFEMDEMMKLCSLFSCTLATLTDGRRPRQENHLPRK